MENNIGKLNAIFMQNITSLFGKRDGGKIIKEYVSLIRDNKSLLKEYKVFNFIEAQRDNDNLKDYINESIGILNNVDRKELNVLHDKLSKFMSENKINQIEDIKNEKLFEDIHSLIFTKKTIKTINERIDKVNNIVNYIKENTIDTETDKIDITESSDAFYKFTIDKFNKKYMDELNENEQDLFKLITSNKNDTDKSGLFEQERLECIKLADEFLNETIDTTTREKVLVVKEKLSEQKYSQDSYIDDILSFIELKQTLSE